MTRRSGGHRLPGRDMLSYGFKYGEPWGDDRRAFERAFRDADAQSDRSRSTSDRTRSDFGSSTMSTMSSLSSRTSTRSGGSTAYQDSRSSRQSAYRDQAPSGLEVVRVGSGGRASGARSVTSASEHGYRIPTRPRTESGRAHGSQYSDDRRSDYGYGNFSETRGGAGASYGSDIYSRSSSQGYGRQLGYYGTEYSTPRGSHHGSAGTFEDTGTSGYQHDPHHEYDSDTDQGDYDERASGYIETVYIEPSDSDYDSGSFVTSEDSSYASDDSDVASGDSHDDYNDYSDSD